MCRRENRKEAKSIDSSGDCVVVKEVSAGQTALKTGEMRAGEEAGGTAKSIDSRGDWVVGKEVCQRARNGCRANLGPKLSQMDARGSVLSTSGDRFRFPGFGVGGQGQPPSEAPHRRPKTARHNKIDRYQW